MTCSVLYGLWRQLIFAACDGYRSCPVACLFSPSVMFFDEYKFLISVWCCFRIVSFRVAIFESCVVDLSLSRGRQIPSGLTFLSILPFPLQSSEHLNGVSIPHLPMLCSVGFCLACPRLLKTCSSPFFCRATLSHRPAHVLELWHPIGGSVPAPEGAVFASGPFS